MWRIKDMIDFFHNKFNVLVYITLFSWGVNGEIYSKNISDAIFRNYDSAFRPKCDGVNKINTTMGIAIRQVIALDEPNQIAKLNLWIRLKWNDCLMKWAPSDYDNTDHIIIPVKRIWHPDLTLYASVSTKFHGLEDYKALVYYDGTVYYNFPTIVEVLCPINVRNFPYDTQICTLKFGSWVYHGLQMDLQPRDSSGGDLSQMKSNVEWLVPQVPVSRHVVYYGCCPEPYPDITFDVYLERKPAYYVINIILPSVIITVLAILGYFLPVDSGEKVSLVITVLLSMSVFQLLVADKLPPSADSVPWIMFFFNFILGLSAMSTMMQVFVINVYYRGDKEVPVWMKRFIIRPLCFMTFVTIHGEHTRLCCGDKNQVEDFIEMNKEPQNAIVWQSFSVALDRLGIFLFSFTLMVGCCTIFTQMKGGS